MTQLSRSKRMQVSTLLELQKELKKENYLMNSQLSMKKKNTKMISHRFKVLVMKYCLRLLRVRHYNV